MGGSVDGHQKGANQRKGSEHTRESFKLLRNFFFLSHLFLSPNKEKPLPSILDTQPGCLLACSSFSGHDPLAARSEAALSQLFPSCSVTTEGQEARRSAASSTAPVLSSLSPAFPSQSQPFLTSTLNMLLAFYLRDVTQTLEATTARQHWLAAQSQVGVFCGHLSMAVPPNTIVTRFLLGFWVLE